MSGDDWDLEELADLARATEALRPGAGFGDEVMRAVERDDGELEAAGGAAGDPGLRAREELAVVSDRVGVWGGIARSGWGATILAACAAAACLLLSLQAEQRFDAEVMVSVDTVEVAE